MLVDTILFDDYVLKCEAYIYFAPSADFLTAAGENSVLGYACLRPGVYHLTLRLRPGVKRSA